jgi:hypothetical protein
MRNARFLTVILALALAAAGCYSFRGGSVPAHLKTVAIPLFDDQSGSGEPRLREAFTNALLEKFRQDNSLEISDKTHADSMIEGTIVALKDEPYNLQGESVTSRRITISVKAAYQDLKLRKKVWEKDLSNWGIYESSGDAAQRQAGIDAAIVKLTEDILNETVSGW